MFRVIVLMSFAVAQEAVLANNHYRKATFSKYGPNVCAVEEVMSGVGHGVSTYRERGWSLEKRQQRTCRPNTAVRYECCEGFKPVHGRPGCTGVKSPKNVLETAQELGAREFVRYAKQNGLYDLLTTGGPYTIFAPTDDAFAKMDESSRLTLASCNLTASEIIKYHVVPQRIVTYNMSADSLLCTLNDGLQLRFNKYSTKIETINCVTLARKNRIAQNGVVHLINSVLSPYSYSNRNLVQSINQNAELTIFAKMIEIARVHQSLKDTFQTITVLAPTDNAIRTLPPNQIRRILNDEKMSKEFVSKHMLATPVCLSAITEEHYVKSLADNHYVEFSCDALNSSVTIQGNCISNDLKLTSNGLLYTVNFVLSNEEGKSMFQIMQQHLELTEFIQIVNVAGLTHTFESHNYSLTVFAPTNQAMRCLDPIVLRRVQTDPDAARKFVEHHVAKEIITPVSGVYDNKMVESLARGQKLRLQCIQNVFGIEGHRLNLQPVVGFNGAVHTVDKALLPLTVSVEDLVANNNSFSIYARAVDLLSSISPSTSLELFCGNHNTYFLPTDCAFNKLGSDKLTWMFNNPLYLRKVLYNHRVERMVSSELIKDNRWQYEIQTKNEIVCVTNKGNQLMVNNVRAVETDIMTTNGIVHVVDDLIVPQY
ncbi:periostin [Adelges cooleyi]|uniref:periostin n=1 Tax=Adelges cooleyi TaxID=133065 RepID=UPI00218017FC|nr:periostin [Adelges cooleyi]